MAKKKRKKHITTTESPPIRSVHWRIKDHHIKLIFVSIIIILAFFYLSTLNNELCGLGGDNAQYIFLAESLFTGKGYRTINVPHEPIQNQYPPCYPLLLLPIIAFAGRNFLLMHIQIIILSILALIMLYLIAKNLRLYSFSTNLSDEVE